MSANPDGRKPVEDMTNAEARAAYDAMQTRAFDELSLEEQDLATRILDRIKATMHDQSSPESRRLRMQGRNQELGGAQ